MSNPIAKLFLAVLALLAPASVFAAPAEDVPIPTKAPVCNGIMPPWDSGIMAPPYYEMIPPGRRVR